MELIYVFKRRLWQTMDYVFVKILKISLKIFKETALVKSKRCGCVYLLAPSRRLCSVQVKSWPDSRPCGVKEKCNGSTTLGSDLHSDITGSLHCRDGKEGRSQVFRLQTVTVPCFVVHLYVTLDKFIFVSSVC